MIIQFSSDIFVFLKGDLVSCFGKDFYNKKKARKIRGPSVICAVNTDNILRIN